MRLRLYVEDKYFKSYETLATKWHSTTDGQCSVNHVRAVKLGLKKMRDEMPRYVRRAQKDGFGCVVFVLDQEKSGQRSALLNDIRAAFERLCQEQPHNREIRDMKVALVVAKTCLECWILTDVKAIVYFVYFACRRGTRVRYSPQQRGDTEQLDPGEAVNEITHILREVGKRQNKRDLKRIKFEKSQVPDMVDQMNNLPEAIHKNHSLKCFCDTVTCRASGCDRLQPGEEI